MVHGCFQLIGITIEDTIACHDVVKGQPSKVGVQDLVHTATKPSYLICIGNRMDLRAIKE